MSCNLKHTVECNLSFLALKLLHFQRKPAAGGLDFVFFLFFANYTFCLKSCPENKTEARTFHALKMEVRQGWRRSRPHPPPRSRDECESLVSACDRPELRLAFARCSKECPLLMTTAVGLITPEKIIKFLHISQKQMEELQKGSGIWGNIWDYGSSKEGPSLLR